MEEARREKLEVEVDPEYLVCREGEVSSSVTEQRREGGEEQARRREGGEEQARRREGGEEPPRQFSPSSLPSPSPTAPASPPLRPSPAPLDFSFSSPR